MEQLQDLIKQLQYFLYKPRDANIRVDGLSGVISQLILLNGAVDYAEEWRTHSLLSFSPLRNSQLEYHINWQGNNIVGAYADSKEYPGSTNSLFFRLYNGYIKRYIEEKRHTQEPQRQVA